MTATIFGLLVGLFSLDGLAVAVLGLPVQSSPAQRSAFVTTIGLASPATAAYTKEASAPTALNPEQNRNLLPPDIETCSTSEARLKYIWLFGLPTCSVAHLGKARRLPLRALFFCSQRLCKQCGLKAFHTQSDFFPSFSTGMQGVGQLWRQAAINLRTTSVHAGANMAGHGAEENISSRSTHSAGGVSGGVFRTCEGRGSGICRVKTCSIIKLTT